MRGVAIVATWLALCGCLSVAAVYGTALRWEDNPYGRHVMAGMLVVSGVVGTVLTLLYGRHTVGTHTLVTVVMGLLVAVAVWRLVIILRRPNGKP